MASTNVEVIAKIKPKNGADFYTMANLLVQRWMTWTLFRNLRAFPHFL